MAKKKKYVLFSPIGRTDPVRGNADGPFLHILRHYKPVKAVLYLTKETYETHRKDNRYCEMARLVSPDTNCEITGDETLVNVHRFEIFDVAFRRELEKLKQENPGCEILVNISSGTPQMEASLYMLKATLPFIIHAIQVATPVGKSNDSQHMDNFDAGEVYAALKDNNPDSPNRCTEVQVENAQATIRKEKIRELVDSFDYVAAQKMTEKAGDFFDKTFCGLLNAAQLRLALKSDTAIRLAKEMFEEKDTAFLDGYEYILMLGTLLKREAYGDYTRAFSPALTEVLKLYLRQRLGLNMNDLCEEGELGAEWMIMPEKVQKFDSAMKLYLDNEYKDTFRKTPLSASVMLKILHYYEKKREVQIEYMTTLDTLRTFERCARNRAAHQITPITYDEIVKWTATNRTKGISPQQAQQMLQDCYAFACGKTYHWDGYEKMNKALKTYL